MHVEGCAGFVKLASVTVVLKLMLMLRSCVCTGAGGAREAEEAASGEDVGVAESEGAPERIERALARSAYQGRHGEEP